MQINTYHRHRIWDDTIFTTMSWNIVSSDYGSELELTSEQLCKQRGIAIWLALWLLLWELGCEIKMETSWAFEYLAEVH